MRMDDETLKRILQEASEYDADCIMKEVNSNLNLQEVVIPADMDANIKEEIDRIKAAQAQEQEKQAQEEQELIRLGKLYKKKRARNKYIILIAAVVCALGIGTISFGDGKKVFTEIKGLFGETNHTRVSDGDDGKFDGDVVASEEDAYEEINEKFGFYPVKMLYMPEGMRFVEFVMEHNTQCASLYYEDVQGNSMSCSIITNHREGSVNIDVEDQLKREYEKKVEDTVINIQEYAIKDSSMNRWMINFSYNNAQYSIVLTDMEEQEVDKIIDNLYFS